MDFNNTDFNRVIKSWNIAIRKAWNLPYKAHRFMLPTLAGHNPQNIIFCKFLKLYRNMCHSKNEHVQYIAKMAKHDARSLINQNVQKISSEWNVDFRILINCDYVNNTNVEELSNIQMDSIRCILEIDSVRNNVVEIPGFSFEELYSIYEHVAES